MADLTLTNLYLNQEFEKLIAYCDKQIASGKTEHYYHGAKGKVLFELQQYNEAISVISIALQLNPDYAIGFYNRAMCYFQLEKYEVAILDFEAAQRINQEISYYDLIGLSYLSLNQNEEAIHNFGLFLKQQPDIEALKWRAEAYSNLGQHELALKDHELILLLELEDGQTLEHLKSINKYELLTSGVELSEKTNTKKLDLEQHNFILCPHGVYKAFFQNTSGVYVLQFSNKEYYVGQTTKLLTRLKAHQKVYNDIAKVYFKPVTAANLLTEETKAISLLESNKVRIRNLEQIEFSSLFSSDHQKKWLNNSGFNFTAGQRFDNDVVREKYKANFRLFSSKVYFQDFVTLVSEYIKRAIPNYVASEYNYWSISCLPKYLAKQNFISRININAIPVLSVYMDSGNSLKMMLCVSKLPFLLYLQEHKSFHSLFNAIPSLELQIRNAFENTEGDELILFIDQVDFLKALSNEVILSAIRMFNLRMMNNTGKETKYRRTVFHCLDLSDLLIQSIKD